jgi:UDP-glucose 4-epimerase
MKTHISVITGGLGYVGQSLAYALQSQGINPILLDHRQVPSQVGTVPIMRGDVGDRGLWHEIFQHHHVDAVYHCAGLIVVSESVAQPLPYFVHNAVAGINMLNALVELGPEVPIIFSSSAAVYGTPDTVPIDETAPTMPMSPYGITKRQFEEVLSSYGAAYGTKWVALRYFNVAGTVGGVREQHQPETHLLPRIAEAIRRQQAPMVYGHDYPTPDGTAIRDYIHMADLTEAHILSWRYLKQGGTSRPFNVGSGHGHSVLEVIRGFERVLGTDIPISFTDRRPGDPPILVASIDAASSVLGFRPVHSQTVDDMVRDVWQQD